MHTLNMQAQDKVSEIAHHYNVSSDAAMVLLEALSKSGGSMAQFNHNELGGGGQWMRGGMTMVSDIFDQSLKTKVAGLCSDLSELLKQQPFEDRRSTGERRTQGVQMNWWPEDLGTPNSSGGQNNIRYAYFGSAHRLAVETNGEIKVYDTKDHQIYGVAQQQGENASLTFSSQLGDVEVSKLPLIAGSGLAPKITPPPAAGHNGAAHGQHMDHSDVFLKIEKLGDLLKKGMLSQHEFDTKKAELLGRI